MKAQERNRKKSNLPKKAEANVWEDVLILIGEPRNCRNIAGETKKSAKILLETFQGWLKMTIDIHPPSKVVSTSKGTILLNKGYRNKVYQHGLLLGTGNSNGQELWYGYNLAEGSTGRDRNMFGFSDEVNAAMASIWSEAIASESKGTEVPTRLDTYTSFLDADKDCADCSQAWRYLTEDITRLIFDRTSKKMTTVDGRVPFFVEVPDTNHVSYSVSSQ
jgi:hypothetical protein